MFRSIKLPLDPIGIIIMILIRVYIDWRSSLFKIRLIYRIHLISLLLLLLLLLLLIEVIAVLNLKPVQINGLTFLWNTHLLLIVFLLPRLPLWLTNTPLTCTAITIIYVLDLFFLMHLFSILSLNLKKYHYKYTGEISLSLTIVHQRQKMLFWFDHIAKVIGNRIYETLEAARF